ncbi:hypothetical protein LTR66_000230 [Elasticomyces elasticus]|nr:hypothetical protein LTR66_000230 [Elasticomyces elasticus]
MASTLGNTTLASLCASASCQIYIDHMQLLYFSATQSTVTPILTNPSPPITAIINGMTLSSGSVYLSYDQVYALNGCGGKTYGPGLLTLASNQLSVVYATQSQTSTIPLDFDCLNYSVFPSISTCANLWCTGSTCTTSSTELNPELVYPIQFLDLDPQWTSCGFAKGFKNPPIALAGQPVSNLAVTTAVATQVPSLHTAPSPIPVTTTMAIQTPTTQTAPSPTIAPVTSLMTTILTAWVTVTTIPPPLTVLETVTQPAATKTTNEDTVVVTARSTTVLTASQSAVQSPQPALSTTIPSSPACTSPAYVTVTVTYIPPVSSTSPLSSLSSVTITGSAMSPTILRTASTTCDQTLAVGGPATTTLSSSLGATPNGIVAYSESPTSILPLSTADVLPTTIAGTAPLVTGAVVTVDGQIITAYETQPLSASLPVEVVIGSQTLTIGGQALQLGTQLVSAASSFLVDGTQIVSYSEVPLTTIPTLTLATGTVTRAPTFRPATGAASPVRGTQGRMHGSGLMLITWFLMTLARWV